MLVSLTVGKVDAGVAVLLTEDKRLIEFPSILLPSTIASGSIVDIKVTQNLEAEQKAFGAFAALQSQILDTYGLHAPTHPVLRLRNATQTSLVLEWDPIQLATTTLRSLSLYRNGSKAGNIPRPMDMQSTKISGLAVDTEYSFYLVLRTSGGTYTSNPLTVKTHSMTNLTGITVTPGILPPQLRESLEAAVERIGAKLVDTVRIDTTHFVCTEGRGRDWERANDMNIPVVRPEWIEGCEREGKIIGVRGYYLDADPRQRQVGSNPSLATARPSTSAASGPVQQQANVPQQPREPAQTSPDAESAVSGEPGPEVLPTPPAQKDLPPIPVEKAPEESEEEDEEDDEDDEEEPEPSTTEPKDKGKAVEPPDEEEAVDREVDEDEEDEDEDEDEEDDEPAAEEKEENEDSEEKSASKAPDGKGGEMEDVAL